MMQAQAIEQAQLDVEVESPMTAEEQQERMEEHRYDVGLRAKITDNWGVGTNYYWTRGSADSEAVGVSVIRSF